MQEIGALLDEKALSRPIFDGADQLLSHLSDECGLHDVTTLLAIAERTHDG